MNSAASSELASGKLRLDEPAPHVLRLTIANEQKRGALDHEMLDAIRDTVAGADARCLLITGVGKVFSAGYDIGNFDDETFERDAERLVAHPFAGAMEALERYRFPIVCAINGHAIGGGLELALSCDIRIVARGATLGMPPVKIGLTYSHTGVQKFIDACGIPNTNELFLVGRNVDVDRAYDMGLVNAIAEPEGLDQSAVSLAGEIGAAAPLALERNKTIIRTLRRCGPALPADVERELVELREATFATHDFREGIRAFAEKRQPRWEAR